MNNKDLLYSTIFNIVQKKYVQYPMVNHKEKNIKVCVYMLVCVCVCGYKEKNIKVCVYVCVCLYKGHNIKVCVYVCVCIHTHTYTHTLNHFAVLWEVT